MADVTRAEAMELVKTIYTDDKVIGSTNQTGVAQNIMLAMLILEIRGLHETQRKVATAMGVASRAADPAPNCKSSATYGTIRTSSGVARMTAPIRRRRALACPVKVTRSASPSASKAHTPKSRRSPT